MSRFASAVVLSGVLAAACSPGSDDAAIQQAADFVLTGAKVFTANEQQPWAAAVAIQDGRFVYVGDAAGARVFQAESTKVVDLGGRLVIPGLIDSHAHPGYINVEVYGEINASSEAEMLEAVRDYADAHPDKEWLRLCCWPIDRYVRGNQGPDKKLLDAVVPDRPLWFVSEMWHSGWLNSKALEELGVSADTADPKSGVATYVRDEDGGLTGWVKEGAAWQHFAEHFPLDDPEHEALHKESVVTALRQLSEAGVTTLYDAGNFGFEDEVYGFLAELDAAGELPVRYRGTYQVFTPERRHHAVAEMERLQKAYGGKHLGFDTVKLFMDGIFENRTAAIYQPYQDDPGYSGDTLLSTDELQAFLLELNAAGFDIHIHAEGDMAVRRVLDAVKLARGLAGEEFGIRVTISHLGLIDAADLPRFKELGVIANYTPWWFTTEAGEPERARLGDDRFERMFDPQSLLDLGTEVTLSSDEWWGGAALPTYLNPYFGMQIAHTRRYPSEWREQAEAAKPPVEGQLSIAEVIRGYTVAGAYQLNLEDEIGSIEQGKIADLVIFDESLFEVDSDRIWKTRPRTVMMAGEVIRGALPGEAQ